MRHSIRFRYFCEGQYLKSGVAVGDQFQNSFQRYAGLLCGKAIDVQYDVIIVGAGSAPHQIPRRFSD